MSGISGNQEVQSRTLENLSDAVNYRRWLCDLARPHLGRRPIEAGSGLGDYAVEWLDDVDHLVVTEGASERVAALRSRFTGDDRVDVRTMLLPSSTKADHSAFIAFNVLEHIEDDVAALRSAADLLADEGVVVLVVPAFQWAMSRFDIAVGHYRRYTVPSLRKVLVLAGLEPVEVRYINPLGLLAWLILIKLLGRYPSNGPLLRLYDGAVVPLLRKSDRRHVGDRGPRFGQAVFAVARKQPSGAG